MRVFQPDISCRKKRTYLPVELRPDDWNSLQPFFLELAERKISSADELYRWILDRGELQSVIEDELAIRFINTSRDTRNEVSGKAYADYVSGIMPMVASQSFTLNRKMLASPHLSVLRNGPLSNYCRSAENAADLFRESNVALLADANIKAHEFKSIVGKLTVHMEGKEIPLPQAARYMKGKDRGLREEAFRKMARARLEKKDVFEDIFDQLLAIRHTIATNAGFDNFRDYAFRYREKFDYTPEDCSGFHLAVEKEVLPLIETLNRQRKENLEVESLRPWDLEADEAGLPPIHPFSDAQDLLHKTIGCFRKLDPVFSECLETMHRQGYMDLESRKGKAPGGFNYPLMESGLPFIFMNSGGTFRDLIVLVHEGGHAVHSYLTRSLRPYALQHGTMEVAELASMGMELLSMKYWQESYEMSDEETLRAKRNHLESTIRLFPWIAAIDQFQHWIYTHPGHSREERKHCWKEIMNRFGSREENWEGLDEEKDCLWHKQHHLFASPFYYIEYGMAQLGALSLWKNFRSNEQETLRCYKKALALGGTKSITEIYETAGIRFSFNRSYVQEVMRFAEGEMLLHLRHQSH